MSDVPGTVVGHVSPGGHVVAGQLVVQEAMMEHPAPGAAADGVDETVHVEVGRSVEAHATPVTPT